MDDFAQSVSGRSRTTDAQIPLTRTMAPRKSMDYLLLAGTISSHSQILTLPVRGLAEFPSSWKTRSRDARHRAAIALAESRLQKAFSTVVPDTVMDWESSPVPTCFALAAEYLRPILEAYADEVLILLLAARVDVER